MKLMSYSIDITMSYEPFSQILIGCFITKSGILYADRLILENNEKATEHNNKPYLNNG